MKKIHLPFIVYLLVFISCSKTPERPKLSLSDYETQSMTSKGVVLKIMNESDSKKMHEMASAIENSRAIKCVAVSDECNLLEEILNKIINVTHDEKLSEADSVEIYKMINQLDQEIRIGREKLTLQWEEYNKAQETTTK